MEKDMIKDTDKEKRKPGPKPKKVIDKPLFNAEQAAVTKGYNNNYVFVVKKLFKSSEKKTLDQWFKIFKETGIE